MLDDPVQQSSDIFRRMVALRADHATVLAAIDGPGGSGKTTLAKQLASACASSGLSCHVVHFDDFYLPSARRPRGGPAERPIGCDFDWPRLRDEVLIPLRRGQAARYARYDWAEDAMAEIHEVAGGGIVIVDGAYSTRRELASLYDLRVWVECPRALRLARGLARDGEHARARWEHDWMPAEDRYALEHRPRDHADVVFDGSAT